MAVRETVIAEDFEAMIRLGKASGRIKDFHDIWIAMRTFPLDLANGVAAVAGTLRLRETATPADTPIGLTQAFDVIQEERGLWTGILRRTRQP